MDEIMVIPIIFVSVIVVLIIVCLINFYRKKRKIHNDIDIIEIHKLSGLKKPPIFTSPSIYRFQLEKMRNQYKIEKNHNHIQETYRSSKASNENIVNMIKIYSKMKNSKPNTLNYLKMRKPSVQTQGKNYLNF